MRAVEIKRQTSETNIVLTLNLDGTGRYNIDTGIGFFDHMLAQFAKHGHFDLDLKCIGDLYIDGHHTVEDVGICLGQAISKVLDDMCGIVRYGSVESPMDEALTKVVIDLCNRSYLHFDAVFTREKLGDFELELVSEFFKAVVGSGRFTLHIINAYGVNNHHIAESIFKGFGRAFKIATRKDKDIKGVLSTKGII